MNASASRTGRPPRAASGGACSSSGRSRSSEPSTATYDAALSRKHHAVPTVSTSTAASAGPKIRDPVITAVFSDDGVVDVLRLDELGDEAAPGRVLEGVEHAEHQRQRPHDGHVGQPGEVEQRRAAGPAAASPRLE